MGWGGVGLENLLAVMLWDKNFHLQMYFAYFQRETLGTHSIARLPAPKKPSSGSGLEAVAHLKILSGDISSFRGDMSLGKSWKQFWAKSDK